MYVDIEWIHDHPSFTDTVIYRVIIHIYQWTQTYTCIDPFGEKANNPARQTGRPFGSLHPVNLSIAPLQLRCDNIAANEQTIVQVLLSIYMPKPHLGDCIFLHHLLQTQKHDKRVSVCCWCHVSNYLNIIVFGITSDTVWHINCGPTTVANSRA